mmetsp:Transcript_11767/g.23870  ORF Transcript_11767/g.23870 Transcript_11767/m.23870 type:complete len:88 (-) Transcript_11767:227-490(-)
MRDSCQHEDDCCKHDHDACVIQARAGPEARTADRPKARNLSPAAPATRACPHSTLVLAAVTVASKADPAVTKTRSPNAQPSLKRAMR